jgi:hypothetical protein
MLEEYRGSQHHKHTFTPDRFSVCHDECANPIIRTRYKFLSRGEMERHWLTVDQNQRRSSYLRLDMQLHCIILEAIRISTDRLHDSCHINM